MIDLDDDAPCADCGQKTSAVILVSWSAAYGLYLCGGCRTTRVSNELSDTEQANAARRYAERAARSQARWGRK